LLVVVFLLVLLVKMVKIVVLVLIATCYRMLLENCSWLPSLLLLINLKKRCIRMLSVPAFGGLLGVLRLSRSTILRLVVKLAIVG
jgi:hypothetical protein